MDITQLQVHFIEVNPIKTVAVSQSSPTTYMVLNVTDVAESDYKWCIFQVNLTDTKKSGPLFWSCKANSILDLTSQLLFGGNIATVLNITDRVISKTDNDYNVSCIGFKWQRLI